MIEQNKTIAANSIMKRTLIGALLLGAVAVLARVSGVLPMPQDMSPPVVIAFCTTITVALLFLTNWYLKRTDEHDRHANLWSMAWAWVIGALVTVNWAMLHEAGVAGAPNAIWILHASAAVAAGIWAWLRFR